MRTPSQFLRQTVTVQDRTEDLGEGPGYADPRPLRCRVDWGRTLVQGAQGEDITVSGTLVIRPEDTVDVGALVTVDGDRRTVIAVTPIYGPGSNLAGRTVVLK